MNAHTDPRKDRGSASVELILIAPVLIAALLLLVVAGRQVSAGLIVQEAAHSAARAASLQRGADTARTQARAAAERELRERGVVCSPVGVAVDASGFAPGGTVSVEVACTVTVADLGGIGSVRTIRANAASPVDLYRAEGR